MAWALSPKVQVWECLKAMIGIHFIKFKYLKLVGNGKYEPSIPEEYMIVTLWSL